MRTGSETRYQHYGLKNIEAQSSSSQTISATRTYDAFGQTLGSSGTWSGPFAYGGAFGYQSEPDSGLQLLGHRYYDPSAGRFLSRDKARYGGNWYAYCGNAPLTSADPTGQIAPVIIGVLAAGLAIYNYLDTANDIYNFLTDPNPMTGAILVIGSIDPTPIGKFFFKKIFKGAFKGALKHADETEEVLEGVYIGTAKNGLPYVGQTGNHFDRIRPGHHKLDTSQPVDFIPMPGSTRREREIQEALILKKLGGPGKGVTANERWPINELLRKELGLE